MNTYRVTLAQLAWVKGTLEVEAESYAEAFVAAKAISYQAAWPINEEGDSIVGFGDLEIDSAYCADESETDHEGEEPAATNEAYRAAPDMLSALKGLDRMNRGLDWCDPDEQARRWANARAAIAKAEGRADA